jgi:hypothetical protein
MDARPAIPPKRHADPVACPPWIYNNRTRVERLWARWKEWRAVATRHEQTARAFLDVLCMAATMDRIKVIPDYAETSANLSSRYGMGGVCVAAVARRGSMPARSERRLQRYSNSAR